MIVPLVVSLATIPLLIDVIGAARYGALAIAWLLLGYFGQADFGIGRAITQRIGTLKDAGRDAMARAVKSAFLIIGAFSLAATALVYVSASYFFAGPFAIAEGLRRELLSAVWLLALCTPLVALGGVASGALMGLERFRLVSLAQILSSCAIQIGPLIAAHWTGPDLPNLILAALIGRALAVLPLLWGVWRTFLAGSQPGATAAEITTLGRFGAWIMVSALVGPMMIFADRLVIGAILGAVAVAAYTIPFQLASRAQMLPIALVNALFPRFASEESKAAHERCRDFSIFTGQLFAPVVIGLICLAGPLLKLWLGDNLDPRSILIGQIILAGFWINALANVPYAYIQARGNPRFTALLHLAELPIYIVLLVALSQAYGLAGFALAFTLRCAMDCAALVWKSGAGAIHIGASLWAPAGLILAALYACQLATSWPMALLTAALLAGAAMLIAIWQMPVFVRSRLAQVPGFARIIG